MVYVTGSHYLGKGIHFESSRYRTILSLPGVITDILGFLRQHRHKTN